MRPVEEGLGGGRYAVRCRHGHKGGRRRGSGTGDHGRWRLLQRDDAFATAYYHACAALRTLGYWRDDVEICWRLQADPPLYTLTGGSAGGAFFAALWHLLTGTPGDFSVTISAQMTPEAHLLPVDHIQKKLDAVLKDPRLSDVIVAADQPEVDAGAYHRLRIWKVSRAAEPHLHGCAQ